MEPIKVQSEILIIGGGIAGCMAAIAARERGRDVIIADKGYAGKGGASIHPDIGMVAFCEEWGGDYNTCLKAMAEAGGFISNREWCEAVLQESKKNYDDMVSWGIEFPPDEEQYWMYFPPIPHVRLKHRKLAPGLRRQAAKVGTRFYDRVEIVDLLKAGEQVVGAVGFSLDDGQVYHFSAKATILSCGSNSFRAGGENCGISGDSDAMAYRAGASVVGKEFGSTTFPSLAKYTSWSRTAHGMVNPAYASFTDGAGQPLNAVHDAESVENEWGLKVEQAIHEGRGPIYWDTTQATGEDLDRIRRWRQDTHNPVEYEWADKHLDLCRQGRFELSGGYAVGFSSVGCTGTLVLDLTGRTELAGLFAAGDAAGTRHNGCYNLCPGMGSAPAAVTGKHAGYGAADYAAGQSYLTPDADSDARILERMSAYTNRNSGFSYDYVAGQLRSIMTPYYVSLIKEEGRMEAALTMVLFLKEHLVPRMYARDPHELKMVLETENMVLNAEMMLRASLERRESRGIHYREDYPKRDDNNWRAWTAVRDAEGRMTVEKLPVPEGMWAEFEGGK